MKRFKRVWPLEWHAFRSHALLLLRPTLFWFRDTKGTGLNRYQWSMSEETRCLLSVKAVVGLAALLARALFNLLRSFKTHESFSFLFCVYFLLLLLLLLLLFNWFQVTAKSLKGSVLFLSLLSSEEEILSRQVNSEKTKWKRSLCEYMNEWILCIPKLKAKIDGSLITQRIARKWRRQTRMK